MQGSSLSKGRVMQQNANQMVSPAYGIAFYTLWMSNTHTCTHAYTVLTYVSDWTSSPSWPARLGNRNILFLMAPLVYEISC